MSSTAHAVSPPIALVTGANRGLGFATARRLAQRGLTVVLGSRDLAKGEEAASILRDEGLDAESIELDVTSVESVDDAARELASRHGRIDILVNNAGVLPEATTPDADQPLDIALFRSTFETNVFGAVTATQGLLPLVRNSSAGKIVNVSSTMGSLADQSDSDSQYYGVAAPAYQMSKAALNGLTIALSKALADTSIVVSSVCPGWVQTDLGGPDNRAAAPITAEEASEVVVDAALSEGPSGQFVDAQGQVAW